MNEHFLGIDFGTCHTLCCLASGAGRLHDIHINGDQSSISSALLWSREGDGNERIKAFGTLAEQEWGLVLRERERALYRFATNFKPDIAISPRARSEAEAFLHSVRDDMVNRGLLGGKSPDQITVSIGVPATAIDGHDNCIKLRLRRSLRGSAMS